jgi:uncharacterized DUF497 family protein
MNSPTDYEFDWDDNKAATNLQKHGVDFVEAMTVLADPLAMTFFDAEHSLDEERWVSVGRSTHGALLLVIHTFLATGPNSALVRLISARRATKREQQQYEQGSFH